MAEASILFLLSVWLVVNTAYAIFNREIARFTNRWDLFRWISAYQLFSITIEQYRLSYRERNETDIISEWQVIPLFIPWKWFHIFWFPEMMVSRKLCSVVDDVVRFTISEPTNIMFNKVQKKFVYRVILAHVQRLSNDDEQNEKQFKIEQVFGLPGNEIYNEVFISAFHSK